MSKDARKSKRVNERVSLVLSMNNAQRNAWNLIRPVLASALAHRGMKGGTLKAYRDFAKREPEKAADIRKKVQWLDQLLDMIGE